MAYNSDRVSFDAGETRKFTEVTVYNATISDEAIKVAMAYTAIYVEQGSLWLTEYFLFANEADRSYLGSKEVPTPGGRETLRFSLPKGATELQFEYGLMEDYIVSSEEGFFDTVPVKPGVREVVFRYRLYYSSGAYTFSQRVNYPITNFDLFVQGEGIKVASDHLITEKPVNIKGTRFNHFSGRDFAPGDILVVQLSGLRTNDQRAVIWVAMALVVLTFGFVYLLRKKRLQPLTAEGSPDQIRQSLLVKIAQLDDDFAARKIPEAVYRRLRADKKAQLVELMRRSKRRDR